MINCSLLKETLHCNLHLLILIITWQCPCQRNIAAHSSKHFCRSKTIYIYIYIYTYSECVSTALGIQHAMRMCRIIFCPVACLALPLFPHYLINGTIFGKKKFQHKMCVLIFSTNSSVKSFLILRRFQLDIIRNVHTCSCTIPVTLVIF